MVGFITERNLDEAEEAFPGINRFFAALPRKPRTFLDLVSLYDHWTMDQHEEVREAA
jgi:hypothetical protein